MPPSLSILLPTYEPKPEHLREALQSLLAQTYPHWTLTVRDDASTADVKHMIAPFLTDPRIRFERGTQRLGIGGNWNACLREATGDLVQFLFQDDLWTRDYLEQAASVFAQAPEIGMVIAPHDYLAEGKEGERFLREAGFEDIQALREELLPRGSIFDGTSILYLWLERGFHPNIVGEPSFVMLRRSVMEGIGTFREDMSQGLDAEYWSRILPGTKVHILSESAGCFRVHAGGASMRNDLAGRGLTDRLRTFELLLSTLPRGDLRSAARRSLFSQAPILAKKFRARLRRGKGVDSGTASGLAPFLLRHPLFLLRCLWAFISGM